MGNSNTIIVTDSRYLDPDSEDLINGLMKLLRETAEGGISVHRLPFFGRTIIVFENRQGCQNAFESLQGAGIQCSFALRDNTFIEERQMLTAEEPTEPEERMPGTGGDETKLVPPPKIVQMQSPPPSPYEGWENQPEEPPDQQTVSDPKSLARILFEPEGNQVKRVFLTDLDLGEGVADDEEVPILMIDNEEAEHLRQLSREKESKV